MSARVLITGAAGFVGARLLETLGEAGYSILALTHRKRLATSGVEERTVDLADARDLSEHVAGCDFVVHAAAALDPVPSEELADAVNHRATVALAEAASRAGVRCFVFLSSMAALGFHPGRGLLSPSAAPRPTTAYGRSKLAAERALSRLSGPMRVVTLRPPTVFGPGELRNFLALVRAIDTGWFLIPGRGENRMSFCNLDTLADAVAWALESERARFILHVADPPIRFRSAVGIIADVLERPLRPIPLPMPFARAVALACEVAFRPLGKKPPLSRARLVTLTSDVALDVSETERLGFTTRHDFRSGVEATVAWYRSQGLLRRR
jgi:UDP-N-acetyl-alpha-D-quinovosamine dehydrogenase